MTTELVLEKRGSQSKPEKKLQSRPRGEPPRKPQLAASAHSYGKILYKCDEESETDGVNCYLLSGMSGGRDEIVRIERLDYEDTWSVKAAYVISTPTPAKRVLEDYFDGSALNMLFTYADSKLQEVTFKLKDIVSSSPLLQALAAELAHRASPTGARRLVAYDLKDVVSNVLTLERTYKVEFVGTTLEKFLDDAIDQIKGTLVDKK